MDGFDVKDFLNATDRDDEDLQNLFGMDIFGLLGDDAASQTEDGEEEEEHVVKFKYSETKKKKLLDAFKITYVNDYGKNDPYHIDMENSFVAQVKNEIHAIYGNRSLVQYIVAMRKVLKVYKEMYDKSVNRLVMPFSDFVGRVVSGDIPGPVNHPLVRTNVPDEILLRYIYDESLDPEGIKQFIANKNDNKSRGGMTFDISTVEEDWNTPVEYEVVPELIQKRMLQSWLSGKLKRDGLDNNYANMVYGLTSHYDSVGVEDPDIFKFDEPISHHSDIISVNNILRHAPEHIHLKHYTKKDLEMARRGTVIRQIMNTDDKNVSPEITVEALLSRMERKSAERNQNVSCMRMVNTYRLISQGIIGVKKDKHGREIYISRDKSKIKKGTINDMIREIERKASVFKDLTDDLNRRIQSVQYSDLIKEVQKEQEMLSKYGSAYFTDAD